MKIKQGYQNYIVGVSDVNVVMTDIHYSQAVLLMIFETLDWSNKWDIRFIFIRLFITLCFRWIHWSHATLKNGKTHLFFCISWWNWHLKATICVILKVTTFLYCDYWVAGSLQKNELDKCVQMLLHMGLGLTCYATELK